MKEIDWLRELNLYKNRLMNVAEDLELLNESVNGIIHHFPFERAAIYHFDTENRIKISLAGTGYGGIVVREDIRECKAFFMAAIARKTIRLKELELEKLLPGKYIQKFSLGSSIIQPLLTSDSVIGFLFVDRKQCFSNLDPELFCMMQTIGKELGTLFESRGVFEKILGGSNADIALSPRELQVLQGLAYGYSIQEIASCLMISHLTARDYCSSLMKKLGTNNRSHAVAIGLRKKLIV